MNTDVRDDFLDAEPVAGRCHSNVAAVGNISLSKNIGARSDTHTPLPLSVLGPPPG